jgi:hypothetical protein
MTRALLLPGVEEVSHPDAPAEHVSSHPYHGIRALWRTGNQGCIRGEYNYLILAHHQQAGIRLPGISPSEKVIFDLFSRVLIESFTLYADPAEDHYS